MNALHPVLVVAPPVRRPWRALALLAAGVTAAHLLLMGLLPLGGSRDALPLAHRFSTRTLVIAPPAAVGGGAPGAAAPAPAPAGPAPTARLREQAREAAPARPRPAPRPKPAVPPAPVPVAEAESAAPVPDAEAVPSPLSEDAAAAAEAEADRAAMADAQGLAAEAPPPAPFGGGGVGAGQGAGEGAGAGAGVPGARLPLQVPGSVRLDFAVTGQQGPQPLSGVFGELIWLQDGAHYNARLALRLLFRTLRTQTSVGRISAAGIEPERFSDARRSEVATHFVRESGQIVFSSTTTPAPLQPGAQDRLSVILQLSALVAGDPERYGPGAHFSIQTAGPRDAEIWQFSVDGDEALETPAGTYQTRKLTRLPRKDIDQKIELWLAAELGWLPARIRQTQPNGDMADMQLRQIGAP